MSVSAARSWAPLALVVLVVVLVLATCQTTAVEIEPDLTSAEFFQRAQEAAANRNYQLAMVYYREFIARFGGGEHPNEIGRLLWADYEIAFLHHKLGDDPRAIELLRALVERYDQPGAAGYPAGPRTLALRVIAELQNAARARAEEQGGG